MNWVAFCWSSFAKLTGCDEQMNFVNYDKRPDVTKYGVCECKHYKSSHDISRFLLTYSKCGKCLCPKYHEIGEFTFEEATKMGVKYIG